MKSGTRSPGVPSPEVAQTIPQRRRLLTKVPGPRSRELISRRDREVPRGVYNIVPVFAQRASGGVVEDVDGNRFVDLVSGISVLNVGNSPPAIVDAVRSQVTLYTHTCFHVTMNEPYVRVAQKLNELASGNRDNQTLLVNSGAEAVENAVKIARYFTGRPAVVSFDHGFHGRTLLAATLTAGVMPWKEGSGPLAPDVYTLPFSYPYRCPMGKPPEECGPACATHAIDRMERTIGGKNIACLIVEPVQGVGGGIVPGSGFLEALKDYCESRGVLLIADEIQTAFGRTGRWFAMEHFDVEPDILVTAKSLGGGLPIGAVTARAEVMNSVHVGGLGSTFGGNPLACVAALAVLEQLEGGLLERGEHVGKLLSNRLRQFSRRFDAVGEVRGLGAMVAIELVDDQDSRRPARQMTARVVQACYEGGVIVLKAGSYENVIRLLPPLTIDDELLQDGLDVVEKALEENESADG